MSPRNRRSCGPPAVLVGLSIVALIAMPAPARAAGPADAGTLCTSTTKASAVVDLSYGADPEWVDGGPPGLPQGYAARRTRDGTVALRVRLVPGVNGTSIPQLCAGKHRLATLPALRRGTKLVNLSVNDRAIAWRTARSSIRGTLSVGRIARKRVRGVRTTRTAATGQLLQDDDRLTVAPNGDAVWALDFGRSPSDPTRAWAWPHGRAVRRLKLSAVQRRSFSAIQLIDDQHVVIDDFDDPIRFAPPTPGACPRLTYGTWRRLQSWRVANVMGFTLPTGSSGWSVVCDTTSGRFLSVSRGSAYSDQYCGTISGVTRIARIGPWLAHEWRSVEGGAYCGEPLPTYSSWVLNSANGQSGWTSGGLAGPNAPAPILGPPYDTGRFLEPLYIALRGGWSAVVFTDGAIAWAKPASADRQLLRYTVTLADAAGTRVVGTATTPSLTLAGTLRWTEDDQPRTQVVTPDPTWAASSIDLADR